MPIFHRRSELGFTLLEILIVLGVVVFLFTLGVQRLSKPQVNIKKVARDLSIMSREIRTQARLKNSTYRLVIEMKPDKGIYWVESAPGSVLVESKETLEKRAALDREEQKSPFQEVLRPFKGKKELPSNLRFRLLESLGELDPVREGLGYVYYSPEGLVQRSALQITDGKEVTWTLLFHPITGHVETVEKALSLKDLSQQ